MRKAWVITVSDRCSSGEREDISGKVLVEALSGKGYETGYTLLPDDKTLIGGELRRIADNALACLIVTTGGTGFSPRDVTPEATLSVADRIVPGIAEAIRAKSLEKTSHAMLSRAVSVIRKGSLIVNLPGSPKGALESLEVFIDVIPHGLDLMEGIKADG